MKRDIDPFDYAKDICSCLDHGGLSLRHLPKFS